jgi:hypothetical protein
MGAVLKTINIYNNSIYNSLYHAQWSLPCRLEKAVIRSAHGFNWVIFGENSEEYSA